MRRGKGEACGFGFRGRGEDHIGGGASLRLSLMVWDELGISPQNARVSVGTWVYENGYMRVTGTIACVVIRPPLRLAVVEKNDIGLGCRYGGASSCVAKV